MSKNLWNIDRNNRHNRFAMYVTFILKNFFPLIGRNNVKHYQTLFGFSAKTVYTNILRPILLLTKRKSSRTPYRERLKRKFVFQLLKPTVDVLGFRVACEQAFGRAGTGYSPKTVFWWFHLFFRSSFVFSFLFSPLNSQRAKKLYSSKGIILLWSALSFFCDINLIYFSCDGIIA